MRTVTRNGGTPPRIALLAVMLTALPTVAVGERLGARYTVESTAYSLCSSGSTMANGRHVRWGAVANNMLALGTRIKLDRPIVAHRADGQLVRRRYFTVADRIGSGSQADFWMPRCDDAIAYGRRVATFRVVLEQKAMTP
jgi:3D (Asp-Asp-Asp) domain-containing protein